MNKRAFIVTSVFGRCYYMNQTTPNVGDGATKLMYTDRHAYTVVAVSKNGRRCTLRRDVATRVDDNGMSEDQDYTFAPGKEGNDVVVSLRKDSVWREVGGTQRYAIGYRSEYYDYSF